MRQRFLTVSLFVIAVLLTVFLGHTWWIRLTRSRVLCPGCNIIIIDIDTFRADAFNCKGKPGDSGYPPNLCEFVKNAFKFENNFSQSHWTLPSSVSTHTGLYPPEHGLEQYGDIMATGSRIVTMPQLLQKNGYITFKVGYELRSFISDYSNTNKGYESFIQSEDMHIWKEEVEKMELHGNPVYAMFYSAGLHSPYILNDKNPVIAAQGRIPLFPITSKEVDEAINDSLLKEFDNIFTNEAKGIPKNRLLNFIYSLQNDKEKMKKYLRENWENYFSKIYVTFYTPFVKQKIIPAEKIHEIYTANVNELDEDLSLFLDSLTKSGMMENSVIVFMSDHGEAFNEHGFMEHVKSIGSQYNEIIQVPLYIIIPGMKGKVIDTVSQNIDIFPTIFEIVGINGDPAKINNGHGKSLLPLMVKSNWWNKPEERFAISFSDSFVSIQNNKWKMIYDLCDDGLLEVYNLTNDKGEKKNISSDTTDISKYLMKILEQTFGFNPRGLGINWEERFRDRVDNDLKNFYNNCFTGKADSNCRFCYLEF